MRCTALASGRKYVRWAKVVKASGAELEGEEVSRDEG